MDLCSSLASEDTTTTQDDDFRAQLGHCLQSTLAQAKIKNRTLASALIEVLIKVGGNEWADLPTEALTSTCRFVAKFENLSTSL